MTVPVPGRATTLLTVLIGAGVGFVASAQPWWQASGDGAAVTFTGSDVTGGLCQALSAVSLAGLLLVLVVGPLGRRVVAVALAVTGLGMALTGVRVSAPDADLVRSRVRQVSLTDQFALTATAWPWVYLAAGLLVVAGAALLWWAAPRWPTRASRFQRPDLPDGAHPATVQLENDPAQVWKDLDAGLDPTADPTPDVADPDVRPSTEGATMDPTHDHRRE